MDITSSRYPPSRVYSAVLSGRDRLLRKSFQFRKVIEIGRPLNYGLVLLPPRKFFEKLLAWFNQVGYDALFFA